MKHFQSGSRMSQAVVHENTIYLAGQVAEDRQSGIADQTRQVLAKIDALLAEAGSQRAQLLIVNIFLPNIEDFDAMNAVYDAWLDPNAPPPARACVEARLADPSLRIEITAVAAL